MAIFGGGSKSNADQVKANLLRSLQHEANVAHARALILVRIYLLYVSFLQEQTTD